MAQTNALSLPEAKRVALERNWDLLAAQANLDGASAQLLMAREFPNPTASLSTAKIGSREASTAGGNGVWDRSYDSILAVNQLFEIAGKRRNRQSAARWGVQGAKARFLEARRILDQGVTKAYLAAVLARENARIYHETAGYLERQAGIAAERFKLGDLSASDKKQIEISAGQYVLQAQAAEASALQARVAVEVLLGTREPKGDWAPVERIEALVTTNEPAALASPTGENAARSDVLAGRADLQAAQANLALQKALRVPDPTVMIQAEHNPPGGGPPADTIGIGVSFPLPVWNRNRGAIKAAQAAVEQSRFALGRLQSQAAADLADARSEYREARSRWERYRDDLAPKSSQVRESMTFAYQKGGASLLSLLDAERTDNDIRLALAQAVADTASATADLQAALSLTRAADLEGSK